MAGFFDNSARHQVIVRNTDKEYLDEITMLWHPLKPTKVFAVYWYLAAARQDIFFRRCSGYSAPWTEDAILQRYRFTNAYRASDRVSQYLIRHIIYPEAETQNLSDDDIFFRIFLFKILNRITTWQLLERSLGEICWPDYSFQHYDALLTQTMERGEKIFSAAYIMPSGRSTFGSPRKHRNYLHLLEWMMENDTPKKLRSAGSLKDAYKLLRSYPMMGDFLAFQYLVDLNYSTLLNFSEKSFVIAGPGARSGIAKCFLNGNIFPPERIIEMMADRQADEFSRIGISFKSLWGRDLQLVDCQNLFCEVDKYARVALPEHQGLNGRSRIKQVYRPSESCFLPTPYYPPKWGINAKIHQP